MLKVVLKMCITFTPLSFPFQDRFFYIHELAYGSRHTDYITSPYERIIGVRLVNIKGYNGYSLISSREGVLQQHKLQRLDVQVFEVR